MPGKVVINCLCNWRHGVLCIWCPIFSMGVDSFKKKSTLCPRGERVEGIYRVVNNYSSLLKCSLSMFWISGDS